MKLIIEKDYQDLSKRAAMILIEEMQSNPQITLGLATGSTPLGMYKELIQANKKGDIDFSQVKTFNLDEYIGLDGNHPSSYRYFMDNELFNHININPENTYVPNGKAKDMEDYCQEYDRFIEHSGGIDIQILGIGSNGHIAFVEPGKELSLGTSIRCLKESTIKDNSRFFNSIEEVPKRAITVGIRTILKARKLILLANGENKRDIIGKFLNSKYITTEIPATLLLLHQDLTVIIDEAAYGEKR